MNSIASWLLPGVVLWGPLRSYGQRFLGDLGGGEEGMGFFVNAYEWGGVGMFGVPRNFRRTFDVILSRGFFIRSLWSIVRVVLDWSSRRPCFFSCWFVISPLCGSHMR